MKCHICNEKAIGRVSPDLDINGIGFCDKHKEDMFIAYMVLISEGEEVFNNLIKQMK